MSTLSKNIRFLRRECGLSQDDIADMLGYRSFTTVQKWESGDSEPNVRTLEGLADIFGVTLNDLISHDFADPENNAPDDDVYYIDPGTRKIAQQVYEDDNLRMLFDASRGAAPEDIQMAAEMIRRLTERNKKK
ncbi:MAG: helix-turn-helix transcriptional regulator [Pseudoramibacter sp. EUB1.1]|uniref:Helix-turn-helix transcriptional regulator n=1 Tax=Candidatus Pseudoramibacter fermentans TaxID=2594427 RepID=A0A6L5GQS1_9FIRM|nr:helix-turn-helix transcriptional regulator [Candidatus Pseudoramibacter fermentans]